MSESHFDNYKNAMIKQKKIRNNVKDMLTETDKHKIIGPNAYFRPYAKRKEFNLDAFPNITLDMLLFFRSF